MNFFPIAHQIASLHNKAGGSTVSLSSGPITSGYALSVFPEYTRKLPGAKLSEAQVAGYISNHSDVLADPHTCVGTWFNVADGDTYLDVSCVTSDREVAIAAAQKANQIAIFDLSTFDEIATGGTGTAEGLPSGAARLPYLFGYGT